MSSTPVIVNIIIFPGESAVANIDRLRHSEGTESTAKVRMEIQKIMQNYAAVFRTGEVV